MSLRHLSAVAALLCLAACGGSSGPVVTPSTVALSHGPMELVFQRGDPSTETWMVFGGLVTDGPDFVSKATVAGLAMADAEPLFDRYPDFHLCRSPGASAAQAAVRQLDLVPVDDDVLAVLADVLERHEDSLASGADRVSVTLTTSAMSLATASVDGEDVTADLPANFPRAYHLVEAAEPADIRAALQP